MLLHHRDKLSNITYLTSDSKSHDVFQIASTMTDRQKKCILLAHAISGCDTVSYLFGVGKVRIMKILADETKTQPSIKLTPLNEFRFQAYKYMCAKNNVQPERLPTTEGAVRQHFLRAYLQMIDWRELLCTSLDPWEFGRKRGPRQEDD